MSIKFDVEELKVASGWGRYRFKNARTRYGILNVPCGEHGLLAFDLSPDNGGNISVNVRSEPRNLTRSAIARLDDFRGFLIDKKTQCARKLPKSKRNQIERRYSQKTENWGFFAECLLDYMEGQEWTLKQP